MRTRTAPLYPTQWFSPPSSLQLTFGARSHVFGSMLIGTLIFAAIVAPLVMSVINDPAFFWRDYYISTFKDGITVGSLARFMQNYLAHFEAGPLFFHGDGNPQHGPAFGVLYLWMLPMMAIGLIAAFALYGSGVGALFVVWLLLYPLGGAITNDGVPHFLRTLVGAPLAAILSGIGLAVGWVAIESMRYARIAAGIFALLTFVALSQFCQAYFIGYLPAAADAYQFENRELFLSVRSLARRAQRICFQGLNDMNSLTLFSYYLRDVRIPIHERMDAACFQPGTVVVIHSADAAPPKSRLVATVQGFNGSPRYLIFLTKP